MMGGVEVRMEVTDNLPHPGIRDVPEVYRHLLQVLEDNEVLCVADVVGEEDAVT